MSDPALSNKPKRPRDKILSGAALWLEEADIITGAPMRC